MITDLNNEGSLLVVLLFLVHGIPDTVTFYFVLIMVCYLKNKFD